MSESTTKAPGAADASSSPGKLLRRAREAQRLPIEALAAAIKVPPRKLELLETDRYAELPDPAFTRGLAQAVCRYLKVDPAPVLALLPPAITNSRIDPLSEGINAPYREHMERGFDWHRVAAPAVWAPLALLIAAAWLYLSPPTSLQVSDWLPSRQRTGDPSSPTIVSEVLTPPVPGAVRTPAADPPGAVAPAPTATPAPAPAPMPSFPVAAPPAAVAPPAAPAASAAAAAGGDALLRVAAIQDSWVEVVDADGRSLIGRTLRAGETVQFDAPTPLRVKVGNAAGTELHFRGEAIDLPSLTRDNVARLRLK